VNRRRSSSLAGSPLLIGAVTTLIVVVAVFLSYNANNGLPFTPTYDINVQLPEASDLQAGSQVRIGGTRVGVVSSMSPQEDRSTGRVTAIAHLKLEKSQEPLPADTTAIVQSVSAIGLKYLSLARGTGSRTLKAGATIPVSQTREPVEIDQLFDMFDKKTRDASQQNLTDFGNGFAGRGLGLNETFHTLRKLVRNAYPVLRNLASPQTGFREFFVALDRAASEVAPVAKAQAGFYGDLDTFFAAWASVAPSLEAAIEGGPSALRQATHSLRFEAPFFEKNAEFFRLLRPGATALRTTAAPLGHALSVGAVNLRKAIALNEKVAEASKALSSFAQNPIVLTGVEDLTQTLGLGSPIVTGLAADQVNCNYVTLMFRNTASLLSESVGIGTIARAAPLLAATAARPSPPNTPPHPIPPGGNSQGLPAAGPATVYKEEIGGAEANLHINPYPQVGAPGQTRRCEAGNEPYLRNQAVIGNVPGTVPSGHELTERRQDLFGRTYPSQTLADLGLTRRAAKRHTPKRHTTKKHAKKKGRRK
jgi:virulence factor Mce-like protein